MVVYRRLRSISTSVRARVSAQVCPMNVYDMVEVKEEKKAQPTRAQDCIICMACVSGCPVSAITVE